jgi:hypothetical protein
MGSVLVAMPSPRLDQDLRIHQVPEPLHAQAFVPELAVEAFIGAVLPRLARIDMSNVDALGKNPLQYRSGNKFRPVVRSHHPRCTVNAHQPRQHLNDTAGADTRGHIDGQAFPCVLVHYRETLDLPTVGSGVVHEVVRPDLASSGLAQVVADASLPHAFWAFSGAPAALPCSRAGTSCPGSSQSLAAPCKHGSVGSQIADSAPRAPARPPAQAHPSAPTWSSSPASIVPPTAAHTPCAATAHVRERTGPAPGERVRSPFFCRHLLHDLDLKVTLGDDLLQPRVLGFQRA